MATSLEIAFGNKRWQLNDLTSVSVVPDSSMATRDVENIPAATSGDSAARKDALQAMFHQALSAPVGFPPIDQAIVPGDTVVLAVDGTLPELNDSVVIVAKWLTERGLRAENLSVLLSDASESVRESLAATFVTAGLDVAVELHDADNQEQLAYLAAADSADPIYMNRLLVEADVVIPVCCARSNESLDGLGCYSIYPLISDRATLGRTLTLNKLQSDSQRGKLREVCDKAAWWLGVLATVQVVPAASGQVANVYCGAPGEIESQVQEAMRSIWQCSASQEDASPGDNSERCFAEADVAVVSLSGDATQHTWLGVARAIVAVQPLVKMRGTIVVCSAVTTPLGKSLRRLSTVGAEPEQLEKKLSQDTADDTLVAQVILSTLKDYELFLASGLNADKIESLGAGSVESEQQLQTLIGDRSCVVVRGGQHFTVSRE